MTLEANVAPGAQFATAFHQEPLFHKIIHEPVHPICIFVNGFHETASCHTRSTSFIQQDPLIGFFVSKIY